MADIGPECTSPALVQNPIQIVIGTDGGSISGSVLASVSGTMPNAVVALVPDAFDLRNRSDLYRSATTDAQGNFRSASVAPGNYKLFAWEWAEPDAWHILNSFGRSRTPGNPSR